MSARVRLSLRPLALAAVALLSAAAPADAVHRRIFATSVSGTGDLGSWPDAGDAVGLAAGDAICQARATAGGLPNAAGYRAWLSTGAEDAFCRVQGLTGKKSGCTGGAPQPAGPWYSVYTTPALTGTVVELTSGGEIYAPVLFDEFGFFLPEGSRAWTGTAWSGTSYIFGNYTCTGWDSADPAEEGLGGRIDATGGTWTDQGRRDCDELQHLLCFETGASDPVAFDWEPASLAFVTSEQGTADMGSWPDAGAAVGLAAGDAICRTLAREAHLPAPDSFVAWLSTDAVNAKDRLTSNGPYRRVDGFLLANSEADLLDGILRTSLHVDEQGRYQTENVLVWTGTTEGGLGAFECGEWDDVVGDGGNGGTSFSRTGDWTLQVVRGCEATASLYCFSNATTIFWDGFDATADLTRWDVRQVGP